MVTSVIEKLLLIQDHDLRIMKFEKELTDLPKRKASIESLLDEHRQAVTAAKEEVKGRQSEIKQVELEVDSHREKIQKFRSQQLQLKSNKEFKAMDDEIATVEKNIRSLEDTILGIMEKLDVAASVVKEREAALKQEDITVRQEISAIDDRGVAIKQELERVKASRDNLASEADPERLALYNRLFGNKRDKVLVPVENAACGGCHMKLPPYVCHEAKKQNIPVFCDFCSRMLY
jgi:predicted  nucleic acid-binding Zn-ribbon protein